METDLKEQKKENDIKDEEYSPPEIEYIPFEPKENGMRTKLYPNPRDCYACEPGEDW